MVIDLNLIRLIEKEIFKSSIFKTSSEDILIGEIISRFSELSDNHQLSAAFSVSYRYSMYYETSRSYEIEKFIEKITDDIKLCSRSVSGISSNYNTEKINLKIYLTGYIKKYIRLLKKENNTSIKINGFLHCMKVCDDNGLHDTAIDIYRSNFHALQCMEDYSSNISFLSNYNFSEEYLQEFFSNISC